MKAIKMINTMAIFRTKKNKIFLNTHINKKERKEISQEKKLWIWNLIERRTKTKYITHINIVLTHRLKEKMFRLRKQNPNFM